MSTPPTSRTFTSRGQRFGTSQPRARNNLVPELPEGSRPRLRAGRLRHLPSLPADKAASVAIGPPLLLGLADCRSCRAPAEAADAGFADRNGTPAAARHRGPERVLQGDRFLVPAHDYRAQPLRHGASAARGNKADDV